MRGQLRIGSALSWVGAWLLALAPTPVYLAWPSDLVWWLTPVLALPLIVLIAWRQVKHGGSSDDGRAGPTDGPWLPPGDHGGF